SLIRWAVDLVDERPPGFGERQVRSIVQRQPVMTLLAVLALFAEALVEHARRRQRVNEATISVRRQQARWVDPRIGLLRLERSAVEPVHDGFVDVSHAFFNGFGPDRSRASS